MTTFKLKSTKRDEKGTGASRRLRHTNKIPAIIYGKDKDAVNITLDHDPFFHATEAEGFFDSEITVQVGEETEKVKIAAIQRHPFKPKILHADFIRL